MDYSSDKPSVASKPAEHQTAYVDYISENKASACSKPAENDGATRTNIVENADYTSVTSFND